MYSRIWHSSSLDKKDPYRRRCVMMQNVPNNRRVLIHTQTIWERGVGRGGVDRLALNTLKYEIKRRLNLSGRLRKSWARFLALEKRCTEEQIRALLSKIVRGFDKYFSSHFPCNSVNLCIFIEYILKRKVAQVPFDFFKISKFFRCR